MLGGLEKVGSVVLKSRHNIQSFCGMENVLYDINNKYPKQKNKWFSIDGKERQMYQKQNENMDKSKFNDGDIKEIHNLSNNDCNIINEHLIQYYTLNVEKHYKYYNPNLIRNQELIKNDPKIIVTSQQVLKKLYAMINI